MEEEEELPYFRELRDKISMQRMKRMTRVAHMSVWSPDVQGIIEMSAPPTQWLVGGAASVPLL